MNTIDDYGGTSIDQLMLGIGEVWYFSSKIGVFSWKDVFRVVGDEHQWLVVILFLVEKSPVNINCLIDCLLVCPQGQRNIMFSIKLDQKEIEGGEFKSGVIFSQLTNYY